MSNEEYYKLLHNVLEVAGIGLLRYRMNGEIVFIEKNALKIFELDEIYSNPDSVIGKTIDDIQHYVLPRGLIRTRIKREGVLRSLEYPIMTLRGKKKWLLHNSYLVYDNQIGEECIQVILIDITELKETRLELEWAWNRFNALLHPIQRLAIISFNPNKELVLWNKGAELLYGLSSNEARSISDLIGLYSDQQIAQLQAELDRVFAGEKKDNIFFWEIRTRQKEQRWIHFTLVPVYRGEEVEEVISIQIDATDEYRQQKEREQLLAEMEHVRRLESIGTMAAGIAHEFNNILMGIMGNAELALLNHDTSPAQIQSCLKQIVSLTERAGKLTRQLLAYAGKDKEKVQILNLNEVVSNAIDLLLPTLKKGVTITQDFTIDYALIEGDSGQFYQLVNHLLTNAVEAVTPEGGNITVKIDKCHLRKEDLEPLQFSDRAQPGEYVVLSVSDNGSGIPNEHLERIFEPFFSTKFLGRGLGLAVVSSIVRNQKGAIRVETEPGKGSTFTIFLPVYSTGPEKPTVSQQQILVVEDEEEVSRFIKTVLTKHGYNILLAKNGYEAIDHVKQMQDQIELIILDIKLPGIDGIETLQQIRTILPDIPVIISSGYSEDSINLSPSELYLTEFIMKPFSAKTIVEKIKTLLEKKA